MSSLIWKNFFESDMCKILFSIIIFYEAEDISNYILKFIINNLNM